MTASATMFAIRMSPSCLKFDQVIPNQDGVGDYTAEEDKTGACPSAGEEAGW